MSYGHRVKSQVVVAFSKRWQYVNDMEQKSELSIISTFTIGQSLGMVKLTTECIVWSQIKFGDMFLQQNKAKFYAFP